MKHYEPINELKREDHDHLLFNVDYAIGGRSIMTGDVTPRGIHLYLTPCHATKVKNGRIRLVTSILLGGPEESGYRVFLQPLKRNSKKKVAEMFEKLKPKFKEMAQMFVEGKHQWLGETARELANTSPTDIAQANKEAQMIMDETKGQVLINKGIQAILDKQGDTSELATDCIKVACKLFNPMGVGEWWVYDRNKDNPDILWVFANLGNPEFAECGTVSLKELESLRPRIERSINFANGKIMLKDVMDKVKKDYL